MNVHGRMLRMSLREKWKWFKRLLGLMGMISGGLVALSILNWDLGLFAVSFLTIIGMMLLQIVVGFIDAFVEDLS